MPDTHSKDADILTVSVKDGKWKTINRGWQMDKGPDGGLLKTAKDGAYAFYDHEANYGALIQYQPQVVDELFLYWHPERPQVNLELRTPMTTLEPGKSLQLAYTIEYLAKAPNE